jgi:hypothetical protein
MAEVTLSQLPVLSALLRELRIFLGLEVRPTNRPLPPVPLDNDDDDDDEPAPRRRRGGSRKGRIVVRKVYHPTLPSRQRERTKALDSLIPMNRTTIDYVVKHPGSTTRQISEGTGLVLKTVESALYQLRHLGLAESVDAD